LYCIKFSLIIFACEALPFRSVGLGGNTQILAVIVGPNCNSITQSRSDIPKQCRLLYRVT